MRERQSVHVHIHDFNLERGEIVVSAVLRDGTVLYDEVNIGLPLDDKGLPDLDKLRDNIARDALAKESATDHQGFFEEKVNFGPKMRAELGQ